MRAPAGDPFVGRTIAHYDIVARVGGGGMGIVYRARDTRLGRMVALKFLPPQWSHDEGARLRFVREAQAASATNHPSICTVHDIESTDDGQLFIVMAYYDGQTLKRRLEDGALPIDEALDIATQVADGLAKAHAQGVVHRDVKPGNVILTDDGARIVDFGLATFADALKLTIEHSTIGTAAYMSPEQVRGESADAQSDVWAVGAMLYEMIAGHVPFQGTHAEAIAYAIRHETPAPLRAARAEVGDDVEQMVFRALHKDKAVRYQNGRELARALRHVRGLTLPVTGVVPAPAANASTRARVPERRRMWAAVSAAIVALTGGLVWWALSAERLVVAVVPVVNQTGHDVLGSYRMALTYALTYALTDSTVVRPVGHDELSAVVRRFRAEGRDISSTAVLQAIAGSEADRLIVPTLMRDGDGWKARVEVRDPRTSTTEAVVEVEAGVSVLVKESAYGLMLPLAAAIEQYVEGLSWQSRARATMRRTVNRGYGRLVLPTRNLDAAAALEEGLERGEELELSAAARAFERAATADPLSAVAAAWRSRVAHLARQDVDAVQLARQALSLLSDRSSTGERAFVQAVAAESTRDDAAERYYRALASLHPDDPAFVLELAGFRERRGQPDQAIRAYLQALDAAPQLIRPHVELCRLYMRVNNPTAARRHGNTALTAFRTLGAAGGQAQALFCLTESLRRGSERERAEALEHAESALQVLPGNYRDNLARGHHYVALALEAQGRLEEAADAWAQSLPIAREVNNALLATTVLMNLGATSEKLGRRSQAIGFLRESAEGFEALGDQNRAAQNLFNVGAILVEYGGGWQDGLRDVQSALAVFEQLRDVNFQVAAKRVIATRHRYAGQWTAAERELSQAIAMAQKADLDQEVATTQIRRAQLLVDAGDYEAARALLRDASTRASARDAIAAQLVMARALFRQGAYAEAGDVIMSARRQLAQGFDAGLLPWLHAVSGELAYEMRNTNDAGAHFLTAAGFLTGALDDPEAVLALAYVGLLEAETARRDAGIISLRRALEIARRLGHLSLEARCRVYLARAYMAHGARAQAMEELDSVPADDADRAVEPEIRAQAHYWRSQALAARGEVPGAHEHAGIALRHVEALIAKLPEARRETFRARPDMEKIVRQPFGERSAHVVRR